MSQAGVVLCCVEAILLYLTAFLNQHIIGQFRHAQSSICIALFKKYLLLIAALLDQQIGFSRVLCSDLQQSSKWPSVRWLWGAAVLHAREGLIQMRRLEPAVSQLGRLV